MVRRRSWSLGFSMKASYAVTQCEGHALLSILMNFLPRGEGLPSELLPSLRFEIAGLLPLLKGRGEASM
jgi:hypothetical protein